MSDMGDIRGWNPTGEGDPNAGYKKYSVRMDVWGEWDVEDGSQTNHQVTMEVESEFKSRYPDVDEIVAIAQYYSNELPEPVGDIGDPFGGTASGEGSSIGSIAEGHI